MSSRDAPCLFCSKGTLLVMGCAPSIDIAADGDDILANRDPSTVDPLETVSTAGTHRAFATNNSFQETREIKN